MTILNFIIEMRRSHVAGPLEVTSFRAMPLRPGQRPSIFSIVDASGALGDYKSMTAHCSGSGGYAYVVFFSLTEDFLGDEQMFETMRKLGLPVGIIIRKCEAALETRADKDQTRATRIALRQSRAATQH